MSDNMVSLAEHFRELREADQRAVAAVALVAKSAQDRAEKVADDFRGQLTAMAATLVTADEFNGKLATIGVQIATVTSTLDRLTGKSAGFSQSGAILLGAMAGAVGVTGIIGVIVAVSRAFP